MLLMEARQKTGAVFDPRGLRETLTSALWGRPSGEFFADATPALVIALI